MFVNGYNSGFSVKSIDNVTIAPLGIGATFTGNGELNDYPHVGVFCETDADGTLFFEFSTNNTDWGTFPTAGFGVTGGINEFHTAVKLGRFFRVRFVNGSSAQTYFRLNTYYGVNFLPDNTPLNQSISLDQDANIVRSTISEDEVALGRFSGVTKWIKWGTNSDVDTGAAEVVASFGGTFTPMTTAQTFTITYNNGTDGAGQNGALTLAVFYIDANGLPVTTVHTLGNTGTDVTSFTGLGIQRVAVSSSGSADVNTNAITFTATTSATIQAQIPAGGSVTQAAIFFTGSNHYGVFKSGTVNIARLVGSAPRVTIDMYIYSRVVDTKFKIFTFLMDTSVENTHYIPELDGFRTNPTDVLWFEATTNTNDTNVNVRIEANEYQIG